jgi:hypothetical protein
MDVEQWSLIVAIAAFVVALGSLWLSRRSTRASERSAAAAERSAAAAEAALPPPPPLIGWRFERGSSAEHALRNIGTETATDVTVEGVPADAAGLVRFSPVARLGPGERTEITIFTVDQVAVRKLKVSCREIEPQLVEVT